MMLKGELYQWVPRSRLYVLVANVQLDKVAKSGSATSFGEPESSLSLAAADARSSSDRLAVLPSSSLFAIAIHILYP